MNITLDKQPQCLATLSIEASPEEVGSRRQTIVQSFANQAKVPGFRPGKVPTKLIEKRFGKAIGEELEQRLIQDALGEAVREEQLALLEVTSVSDQQHAGDGTFSFKAELILAPEFELPEYRGIPVEFREVEVTDEQLDAQLEELRERFADFEDLEAEPLAEGHLAVISYTGSVDGQPLAELSEKAPAYVTGREDHWLRIRPGQFLPGFAEGLVGAKAGESRQVEVTFDEDFPLTELHDKTATYEVEIKQVKKMVLPEIDEAFARRLLGEEGSVEQLRETLQQSLEQQAGQAIEQEQADQVVAWINEQVDLELPERFIQLETQGQAQQMVRESLSQGVTREQIESDQEELMTHAQTRARINLKTSFVLQKIAEKEEIKVADQEILQRIAQIAQQQGQKPEKVLKEMQKEKRIQPLHHSLLMEKTLSWLIDQAERGETTASSEDASEGNATAAAEASESAEAGD